MRKLAVLGLSVVIFFAFAQSSCSSKKANSKTTETQTSTIVKPQTPPNNFSDTNSTKQQNTPEGKVIILTTETFKQKIFDYTINTEWNYLGDKPCIIDFYADWCKPCKLIEPILDEIAKEYAGKLYVYRLNVDENREVAQVFGIRSIPSVLFIPMEGRPQMAIGARPKDFYIQAIKDVLKVE